MGIRIKPMGHGCSPAYAAAQAYLDEEHQGKTPALASASSSHAPSISLPSIDSAFIPEADFTRILTAINQNDQYLQKATQQWQQLLSNNTVKTCEVSLFELSKFLNDISAHAKNQGKLYAHLTNWLNLAVKSSEAYRELEPFILQCRQSELLARKEIRPLIHQLMESTESQDSILRQLFVQCIARGNKAEASYDLLKKRAIVFPFSSEDDLETPVTPAPYIDTDLLQALIKQVLDSRDNTLDQAFISFASNPRLQQQIYAVLCWAHSKSFVPDSSNAQVLFDAQSYAGWNRPVVLFDEQRYAGSLSKFIVLLHQCLRVHQLDIS